MLIATILMILCTLLGQAEGVLIKKYNEKHSAGGFVFISLVSFFGLIVVVVKDLISGGGIVFVPGMFGYGIASGLFYAAASILTFVALGCGPYALSKLILGYSLVFSIGYGLFVLHEPANVFTYIALGLILVSVFLSRPPKKDDKKVRMKWIVCVSLSVIGARMFAILKKAQQLDFDGIYDNEFMILTYSVSFVLLMGIGIIMEKKRTGEIFSRCLPYTFVAGLSNALNNLLGFVVLTLLPISISSPVGSAVGKIVNFIVAILVFREKYLPRQLVALLLGLIAAVILNLKL